MHRSTKRLIQQLLIVIGRQLSLCCQRDMGNLPLEMLRRNGAPAGRLR